MGFFKYSLSFLNSINYATSSYEELDDYLKGVVKGFLSHNQSFLSEAPLPEELTELKGEIEGVYSQMLLFAKPKYEEVKRLTSQTLFENEDETISEFGDEDISGKFFEPKESGIQTEVNTAGQKTEWGNDTVTLTKKEYKTLDDQAVKEFFKDIKEDVEGYFVDFVNLYATDDSECISGCLTPEQIEAINSGINADKVAQIQTNKEDIELLNEATVEIDNDLIALEGRVTTNEGDISSLGGRVTNVESDITDLGSDVDLLGQQIVDDQNYFKQLSNLNLLINGDFKVNQRGFTTNNSSTLYTVDRWYKRSAGATKVDYSNGDIVGTIQTAGSGTINLLDQTVENCEKLIGKIITGSVNVKNIVGTSWLLAISARTSSSQISYSQVHLTSGINQVSYTIPENTVYIRYGIVFDRDTGSINDTITFNECKLEIGSIATPFSPRPYAEELAMCQRYYITYDGSTVATTFVGYSNSSTAARFTMTLPTTSRMRTDPTFSISGNISTIQIIHNGQSLTPTVIEYFAMNNNCITFTLTASGLTVFNPVVVRPLQTISFDAEIY